MTQYQRTLRDGRKNRRGEHALYIDPQRGDTLRAVLIVTHLRAGKWSVLDKKRQRFTAHEDDLYTRQELEDNGLEANDFPWPVPGGIE